MASRISLTPLETNAWRASVNFVKSNLPTSLGSVDKLLKVCSPALGLAGASRLDSQHQENVGCLARGWTRHPATSVECDAPHPNDVVSAARVGRLTLTS